MDTNTLIVIIVVAAVVLLFVINRIISSRRRKRDEEAFNTLSYKSGPSQTQTKVDKDISENQFSFEKEGSHPSDSKTEKIRAQLEKSGIHGAQLEQILEKMQNQNANTTITNTTVTTNSTDDFEKMFADAGGSHEYSEEKYERLKTLLAKSGISPELQQMALDKFKNRSQQTEPLIVTNSDTENISIKIENGVVRFDGDMSKLNEEQKQLLMNMTGKESMEQMLEILNKIKNPSNYKFDPETGEEIK